MTPAAAPARACARRHHRAQQGPADTDAVNARGQEEGAGRRGGAIGGNGGADGQRGRRERTRHIAQDGAERQPVGAHDTDGEHQCGDGRGRAAVAIATILHAANFIGIK
ncbi:hypothetical protein G6F65_020301 [Rhizopus arrhizus]|nr:hypothetical protein G6F65_020301 [Rhizopus arrhizus]